MGDLELFFHNDPVLTPFLLKAALAHVQFVTIPPFSDGNGRLGRLLITLLLCYDFVISEPLFYLSLYFKKYRREYFNQLQRVRVTGDWEKRLDSFLKGIIAVAGNAIETAKTLVDLYENHKFKVQSIGRAASSALRVNGALEARPVSTVTKIAQETGLSPSTK